MGLTAPGDLSEAERVVWDATAPHVRVAGATELLRAWCATVVELRAAEAWVAEHGTTMTIRDDKGNVKSTGHAPKYQQVRALRGDLRGLADSLGLSAKQQAAGQAASSSSGGSALDELERRRAARGAGSAGAMSS